MALLGISLLFASVVYVLIRPPDWLPRLSQWLRQGATSAPDTTPHGGDDPAPRTQSAEPLETSHEPDTYLNGSAKRSSSADARYAAALAMPPPTVRRPDTTVQEPDSPTTPKASATTSRHAVPRFSLSDDSPPTPGFSVMPPPGRLPLFPAPGSAQRARGPVPNRGLLNPSSGGLAPPPTHSSKPQKPSRKVALRAGRSPLDWARISGPNADLRGIDPSSSYLRVTPSMLKRQTGRRGKDAWMALNGRVYNITSYAEYHPGGIPELMRGAARDGTKLFGEIHPWVNYEAMLSACLVGLLVEEPDGGPHVSEMDQMD